MIDRERAELIRRLEKIALEIDGLMRDIGPKWIRVAHLNAEAKSITAELEESGVED